MKFTNFNFRRVSQSGSVSGNMGNALTIPAVPALAAAKTGKTFFQWNFVVHKWLGLFGAVWLIVLGLTGFFLDHPTWRWQVQDKTPTWLTTQAMEKNSSRNLARLLQIDPSDSTVRIAGGQRGLWFSRDAGVTWQTTLFPNGDHPQTLAIEPDPALGWKRLWLATDDGVYFSEDAGKSAHFSALHGEFITSLTTGATNDEMVGVIDKSQVFRFKTTEPSKVTHLNFAPLNVEARPEDVQVNRFMRELHFGTGVADPLTSLVMNDVGGIGMLILSITGLLYWALPKYWKVQAKSNSKKRAFQQDKGTSDTTKEGVAIDKALKAATKKATILWLFRTHSITLGIASALMLIYLSVTGIFVGHGKELGDWMRETRIPQTYLTPAFALKSWDGRIDAIVAYPGLPEAFSIGNRYGLFTTADDGQNWIREVDAKGEPLGSASRLRRLGDTVLVPNGMAGPSVIRGADSVNHEVVAKDDRSQGRGIAAGMGGEGRRNRGQKAENNADGEMPAMDHSRHRGMGGGGMQQPDEQELTGQAGFDARGKARRARAATEGETSEMGGMGGMFMPSDVTRIGDNYAWKSSGKLLVTDTDGNEIEKLDIKQPIDPGVPWFTWFLRLHMGTIFWSEWRWVNDVFSVAAVFLSVTGLIRWWRKKWA